MTISQLALAARRVIESAWLHGAPYDLAAQAAFALESAQLLQSPETVAESDHAYRRVRTAMLAVQRDRRRLRARVSELEVERDALLAERHSTNEALDDAVQELRARQADGITRRIAPVQALQAPAKDVTPQVAKLRALLAGQREVVDGEHYASTHHDYRLGRDLPPLGGGS